MNENISISPSVNTGMSEDSQLRRFKADLKEIIPIDLYEANYRAALLQSDIIFDDQYNKAGRHAKEFYQLFFLLFKTLRRYLPETMEKEVSEWISKPNLTERASQKRGIELFYVIFDEMASQGIGELFETSITPQITNILGDDMDLDNGPSPRTILEDLCEEYINPGDIGNLAGEFSDV